MRFKGERLTGIELGFRQRSQAMRLWLNSGEATGAPGRRRSYDDARHVEGMSRAWSRTSIASWRRWEARLEWSWEAVSFGCTSMPAMFCYELG
jgi:hypothetical protein